MLIRLVHWRTLTFGVSCLLHLGLIAVIVLAEQTLSAHVFPPVLPVELVLPADPPPPQPEPAPRVIEPPKPVPPRPLKLPKPIETPLPAMTEVREPTRPPEPLRAPEPPAPPPPAPAAPVPAQSAPPPPAPPAAPAPAATAMSPPASTDRDPGPPERPGPAVTAARTPPTASAGDGIPLGRPSPSAGAGQTGQGSVASASGREAGSTGAVTRYARPQGGYQVQPGYPATARRLGIQGTTMLRVHVLVDGQVGDVIVQETAGHPDLDQAAADAVRRWRFDPARRGNDPVAMWVLLPVEFRLK
jgi:protein TonB